MFIGWFPSSPQIQGKAKWDAWNGKKGMDQVNQVLFESKSMIIIICPRSTYDQCLDGGKGEVYCTCGPTEGEARREGVIDCHADSWASFHQIFVSGATLTTRLTHCAQWRAFDI